MSTAASGAIEFEHGLCVMQRKCVHHHRIPTTDFRMLPVEYSEESIEVAGIAECEETTACVSGFTGSMEWPRFRRHCFQSFPCVLRLKLWCFQTYSR